MKRLFAAAAFAPLCFAALEAHAQTTITDARTTPVVTSTAGNIEVGAAGSVEVKTGGAAITIDSDNTLKVNGAVSVRDSTNGTAVLITTPVGGRTATVDIAANVVADDTVANTDTDNDGDLDGEFVPGTDIRYGIRATGVGPVIGNISQTSGGIVVESNGGAGISIETGLTGNLKVDGVVGVLGRDSYGVRVTGPLNGEIDVSGTINAQGERAVGLQVEGPVSGVFRIDGTVTAFGYRYQDPTQVFDQTKLDADDLLQGGSAVRIMGSLGRGLLLDAAPGNDSETDTDEDDDGRPDAEEGSAVIRTFGTAPALLIGHSTNAIDILRTGDGLTPTWGLIIRGQVIGNGAFNGFGGTGARIGGLGGTVNVETGLLLTGQINGVGYRANSNGLIIGAGASVPEIRVERGTISAGIDSIAGLSPIARALTIEAGATVNTLYLNGAVRAGVTGPTATSVAVADYSGTVNSITNVGTVSATIQTGDQDVEAVGDRIAFDLRANTTGVTLNQLANTNTDIASVIVGDILFGTGAANDTLNIAAGAATGKIDFGGGVDSFSLGEKAVGRVDLRKPSGTLALDVQGDLTLTNTGQISASTVNLGAKSLLTLTADPQNAVVANQSTFLNASGAATLAAGSKIDVEFISKLEGPLSFEVLRASTLTNNGVDTSLVSDVPYMYTAAGRVAGNSVLVDVRQKSTSELGLQSGRAAIYDAFYASFDADPGVARAFFSKKTEAEFDALFDQFLPDYSGGPFSGLADATRAVYQTQGERVTGLVPGEPRSWLQEVGVGTKFESVNDIEYQTGSFGLSGGIEKPYGDGNSAYGVSASYVASEIRNANRALGSNLAASSLMGSAYWRAQKLGLQLDASASVGYAWLESDRRVVDELPSGVQNLIRQASGDWGGVLAGGRVGAAYDWEAGSYYVRPDAVIDAIYLSESGYTETGGGDAVNLVVGSRDTYEVGAELGLLVGARFGRSFRWGPELRVAYRTDLASDGGETSGAFAANPGQAFILPGLVKDRSRFVVRAAFRGQGAYSNFALEASGDIGEVYTSYMARVVVRFLF